MTKKQIKDVAYAMWKNDFPFLVDPDGKIYSGKVKRFYYTRAKAAIKAYKACSLAIVLTAMLYFVVVSILMWRFFG